MRLNDCDGHCNSEECDNCGCEQSSFRQHLSNHLTFQMPMNVSPAVIIVIPKHIVQTVWAASCVYVTVVTMEMDSNAMVS